MKSYLVAALAIIASACVREAFAASNEPVELNAQLAGTKPVDEGTAGRFELAEGSRDHGIVTKTKAQELRETMSAEKLAGIRSDLAKAHSPNRWKKAQQQRYIDSCVRAAEKEPEQGINRRSCSCILEMVMVHFASFGDYANFLIEGNKPDGELATWHGLCLVAFGD